MPATLRAPIAASILSLFAATAALATVAGKSDTPLGWASQNGGTKGGTGGTEVTVTTMADFQKYASASGKYIIWVSGTFGSYGTRGSGNADKVNVSSDKSILGLPGAHVKCSIIMSGSSNVIIRNLIVEGAGACDNSCGPAGESRLDAITVVAGATNIWLDHLDVSDGEDGNTDITKKSDFVTVSWTKFHYTDKSYPSGTSGYSHRFCNLLGGSDVPATEGANNINVTFYKTWWADGIDERMPRVRFGKVQVANCLFTSTDKGQNHCVRAGYKANLLVESNVFITQKKPIDLYNNDFTAITSRNNLFTNCTGNTGGSGTAFTPPYTLALSGTAGLQAEVSNTTSGAGPTLTWGTTSIIPTPGFEISYAPRLERVGSREILTNPAETPVTASVWSATGRKLSGEIVLQPGASADLPVSSGMRILKLVTSQGQESRVLALR